MAVEMIVTPIIEETVKGLLATTKRQFGYLIHYNRNIENLRNQVKKLEGLTNGVQGSISAAKRNGQEIRNKVENWVARVDGIMVEANKFLEEDVNVNKRCFFGWFPDLSLCYRLGREAQKRKIGIIELQEDGKFDCISNPAAPPGIEFLSLGDFVTFDTTKLAMVKVIEALKDGNINFIGIHGMGGVGKTTLAKEIAKISKKEKLFDNVVIAVVSQITELRKIQDQIADMLGLRFTAQSDLGRAGELHARLKLEKTILIILDDVWARLDVKEIGIPLGVDHEGCKMIITTRREQVCSTMGMGSKTTKIIYVDVLSQQESWDLFRRNAGDAVDSPTLRDVAEEVARECRGLPIALVTVGRAMRNKDLEEWKEAARELQKSMPTNIEGVDEDVYKCLKLSYDYLRDEEAKSCFLLCSLFPEDHDIEIEYLVRYGMGLGILKNVDTINEARSRMHAVINNLRASCLLLDCDSQGCIKLHDVVRDVAISIGSDKYLVRANVNLTEWPKVETLEHYTGISLMYNQISKHPEALECPNLQILLMQNSPTDPHMRLWMQNSHIDPHMPEGVFKGMKALRVLDRSHSRDTLDRLLEPSFRYLTNLRALILENTSIMDTTALEDIKTLEILSFANCALLKSPIAMRHLINLRLLDLRNCSHPSQIPAIIPPNVISSLSRLEELYMDNAISWASEGTSRDLPNLAELKSLPRLTVLTTHIDDIRCIPEDFVFPDLVVFQISISPNYLEFGYENSNCLALCGLSMCSLKCSKVLLQRTNKLSLSFFKGLSNVIPDLLLDGDGLEVLEVEECDDFEYLINTEELRLPLHAHHQQQRGFYNLEELYLFGLENFKGICHGVLARSSSLMKLEILEVISCHKLSNIFAPLELLQRLQILRVERCEALEHVFDLELDGPPVEEKEQLTSFSLRQLELSELDELRHIWKGPTGRVMLHNLQDVSIWGCNKLKNLFPPAIARTLVKLKDLRVCYCHELEEIVSTEQQGQEVEEIVNKMKFPQLERLVLCNLSNLNGFCMGSFSFEWPSLELVDVFECPKMKTFTAAVEADGTQSTPNLKTINVDGFKKDGLDLNTVIQKRFEEKEPWWVAFGNVPKR